MDTGDTGHAQGLLSYINMQSEGLHMRCVWGWLPVELEHRAMNTICWLDTSTMLPAQCTVCEIFISHFRQPVMSGGPAILARTAHATCKLLWQNTAAI